MFRRGRKRLPALHAALKAAREQHAVASEQAVSLREDADDLRVRAVVSERPDDRAEATEAERHAEAAERERDRLYAEVQRLKADIDVALDRY